MRQGLFKYAVFQLFRYQLFSNIQLNESKIIKAKLSGHGKVYLSLADLFSTTQYLRHDGTQ